MRENKRASVLNILTKDIEVFVNGSWQFPYMVVVPMNTIISIFILYSMVRLDLAKRNLVWLCDITVIYCHDWTDGIVILLKQEDISFAIYPEETDRFSHPIYLSSIIGDKTDKMQSLRISFC